MRCKFGRAEHDFQSRVMTLGGREAWPSEVNFNIRQLKTLDLWLAHSASH